MSAGIRTKPIQKGNEATARNGRQGGPRRSVSSESISRRATQEQTTQLISESIVSVNHAFNLGRWSFYRMLITDEMAALDTSLTEKKLEAFACILRTIDSLQVLSKDIIDIFGDDVAFSVEVRSTLASMEKIWDKYQMPRIDDTSYMEILKISVNQVLNELIKWSSQVRIKPDSERLDQLLPSVTCGGELLFANRVEPMKKLLKIHLTYLIRRKNGLVGGNKIFPLLDSLYGMGKTTFSKKYLAMVERWVREIQTQPDAPSADLDVFVADRILSALGYDDVILCPGVDDVLQLLF